ncbi:hypothetical protein F7D14_21630 (plasmid) [Methylocystis parvus]|uniref:Uncharacterized protein n=2 Tax=Methylocystis parvus TaxID=134 RepID=A0A6B8M592_9HYPH|nr:hypothetical protein F7D14_21630 [Methylocystis parvus]
MERSQRNWVAKLRRFATTPSMQHERCELCGAAIGPDHAHLLEIGVRRLHCACDACSLTLTESQRFLLVRPMTEALVDFNLSDWDWESMQLPIDLAFFFRSTTDGKVVALYPGPAGAMASTMSEGAWTRLVAANPMLKTLAPDVEALLINRTKGARRYYRVSIDRCYALVGVIRSSWKGISGGVEAWEAIGQFFSALDSSGVGNSNRAIMHG